MKLSFAGRVITFIAFILCSQGLYGNVTLPVLVSDGMVLQRDEQLVIWGWANAGEKVSVRFNKRSFSAIADQQGNWKVKMPPMKAGGPFTMQIRGRNTIVINDIMLGDVWFCSGQSNMVLNMERVKEKYPQDIAEANYPQIRNFFIPTASDALSVHKDLPSGKWIPALPENVLGFGAASYFFARSLFNEYKIPIGIINSSVGGTPIEAWISEGGFRDFPQLTDRIGKLRDTSYLNPIMRAAARRPVPAQKPGDTDKGMTGALPWYDINFKPEGWHRFWLPGYWEDQGVSNLDGVVWFRKEINIPESMTDKPAGLFMGRIVDADNVYVNGTLAGNITYQYPPRRYVLKPGLLKSGRNIIVVRVTNNSGKGGFVPDKPYYLVAGNDTVDLRGEWLYKVGQVFNPTLSAPGPQAISMQNEPSGLFNTMVAPAINYRIKGFLWYQGETNSGRAQEYAKLLPALISDWRIKWQQGEIPFLYVQLPNFMEVRYLPSESQWAELRFSQFKALSVPKTAMAVTIDAGEWNDIHPLGKKVVGERLALAAMKLAYGNDRIVYSGPVLRSASLEGKRIILEFDHAGSGLVVKGGGKLYYFAIAGADRKFVWAEASIENNRVAVWSDDVTDPQFVRYAWADNPEGANLYNKEGLPASPFEAAPGRQN